MGSYCLIVRVSVWDDNKDITENGKENGTSNIWSERKSEEIMYWIVHANHTDLNIQHISNLIYAKLSFKQVFLK